MKGVNSLKYSQKEVNEILTQILTEMKNYDPNNEIKPNVIFILKELYDALKIYGELLVKIDFKCNEYLFGMEIRKAYNLNGKLFVLHNEICETFYYKIKNCKSPEEMQELLIKYYPYGCGLAGCGCSNIASYDYFDEEEVLNWLKSKFK